MPALARSEEASGDTTSTLDAKLRQPQFDPVDFLNEALPVLNLSLQGQPQKTPRSTQIQTASNETITLLASLNSHNIRSSSELTTLTDEIIRSGNRLAYEVEVLRGDVNGLHELLTESLRGDIRLFVQDQATIVDAGGFQNESTSEEPTSPGEDQKDPEFIKQLRRLGKVKARLEAVITIFGEAMNWSMPPSDMNSSLISVSAPELGIQNTEEDDKAREVLRAIRVEITELLESRSGYDGVDAASQRVDDYRQLALLWKGTGEEKARSRFVDTLSRIVEDRRKALDSRSAQMARSDGGLRSSSASGRNVRPSGEPTGAAGLFRNLQRLKDDLYLD